LHNKHGTMQCDSKKRKMRDVDAGRFFFQNKNTKHEDISLRNQDNVILVALCMNWTSINPEYSISTEHVFEADRLNTPKNVMMYLVRSLQSKKTLFTGQYYQILEELCMGNEKIEMHMFLENGLQSKNRVSRICIPPQQSLIQIHSSREVTFPYIDSKFLS